MGVIRRLMGIPSAYSVVFISWIECPVLCLLFKMYIKKCIYFLCAPLQTDAFVQIGSFWLQNT